jgi:hypothetical protein
MVFGKDKHRLRQTEPVHHRAFADWDWRTINSNFVGCKAGNSAGFAL